MKPEEAIKKAREKKLFTQSEMADRLSQRLNQTYSLRQYQRLEDGEFPKFKKEVVKAVDAILGTSVYDMIYDTNNYDQEISQSSVEENEGSSLQKVLADSDPLRAIMILAETNSRLTDTNKIIAEANYKLVSSNEELVQLTKQTIADAQKESHSADYSSFDRILELLIQVGTGTRWKSREEAVSVLNNVLYGPGKTKSEKGIQIGSGK